MNHSPDDQPKPNPLIFEGSDELRTTLFGLAFWSRDDQGRFRLRFLWRRVLATVFVLAVVGWTSLSAAAWWFVTEKRHVPDVSFFDIAVPQRWPIYQKKRGDAYVEQAKEALEKQLYREAFQMLRVGIAKSPGNLEGRLELARFYLAIRRPDHAATVMEGGLPYADDQPDFLGAYVQMLLAQHMDREVMEMAERLIPAYPPDSRQIQYLTLGAATASYLRGDYDAALRFLSRPELLDAADATLLRAKIEWQQGYTDVALLRVRSLIESTPQAEQPYETLIDFLRQQGRDSEADSAVIERAIAFPQSAPAQSALLELYSKSGNKERLAREIESMIKQAPRDAAMFRALTEHAVTRGDIALADRLAALPKPPGITPEISILAALETRLTARQYEAVIEKIDALEEHPPEWANVQAGTLAGLAAVAHFGIGDLKTAEPMLGLFVDGARQNPRALLAVADKLLQVGAAEAARTVLERAVEADARNESMLARLIELDLETDSLPDLPANTDRLLSMRKIPLSLLRRIRSALGSDRFLFAAEREQVIKQLDAVIARHEQQERVASPEI